jgi:predicted  nucleic acid-binding Zn-ribbon protein
MSIAETVQLQTLQQRVDTLTERLVALEKQVVALTALLQPRATLRLKDKPRG